VKKLNRGPVVLLVRLYLGGIFLLAGAGKIFKQGPEAFVGHLHEGFGSTVLPEVFVTAFGYTLPFVEFIVGITLILGLFRRASFTVAALLCVVLSHGQFMIQEHATAAHNGIYFLVALTGLVLVARPTFAIDSYFEKRV
jgi:thiosulfate dehydrogenase [quinone] large subunit